MTLFAARGSATTGHLRVTAPHPYEQAPLDVKVREAMHLGAMAREAAAGAFDIVHAHCDFPALPFAPLLPVPLVLTLHGLDGPETRAAMPPIWRAFQHDARYVAISRADRHPSLRYAATIHHGLDLTMWSVGDPGPADAPLAFCGRCHPDKGPAEAMVAARAAGIVADEPYHRAQVEPGIDGDYVCWLVPLVGAERGRFLAASRARLHLIAFDEPFGLSVVEAIVCGTPVIAIRRGSMAEIVEEGVTVVLIDSVEEAPGAIARIGEIDRRSCAKRARARLSADSMASSYEALYLDVIGRSRSGG